MPLWFWNSPRLHSRFNTVYVVDFFPLELLLGQLDQLGRGQRLIGPDEIRKAALHRAKSGVSHGDSSSRVFSLQPVVYNVSLCLVDQIVKDYF